MKYFSLKSVKVSTLFCALDSCVLSHPVFPDPSGRKAIQILQKFKQQQPNRLCVRKGLQWMIQRLSCRSYGITTEGEQEGKARMLTWSDRHVIYLTPTSLSGFFAVVDTHMLISCCLLCLACLHSKGRKMKNRKWINLTAAFCRLDWWVLHYDVF